MTSNSITVAAISNELTAFKQYVSSESELKALPKSEVRQINLETKGTIATVLGVLVKLRPFRDQIATLPGSNMEEFDAIERYAGALSQADAYHSIATSPPDDIAEVQAEGVALRDIIYIDAQVQMRRGLISDKTLDELKGPVGYKNLAADLQSLSTVYLKNWDKLRDSTSVTEEEVEKAQRLSFYLFRVSGQKEQSPAVVAETADMRARAFTRLTNAYDNARRAIIYLRWHEGDADIICPSLYAGRSNGRGKASETQSEKPATSSEHAAVPSATQTPNTSGSTNVTHTPEVTNKGPFV